MSGNSDIDAKNLAITENSNADILHQYHRFKDKENSCIVSLTYRPRLREEMYSLGVSVTNVINIFDYLQATTSVDVCQVTMDTFPVPEGAEKYIFEDIAMIYVSDVLYAKICLVSGQVSEVFYYESGDISSSIIVDDRGFISCVTYYESGVGSYREYLNSEGVPVFREYMDDREFKIEICKGNRLPLKNMKYISVEELVLESWQQFIYMSVRKGDGVIVALDKDTKRLVSSRNVVYPLILSCYKQRYEMDNLISQLSTRLIVVSSLYLYNKLFSFVSDVSIVEIPAYTPNILFGESSYRKENIICINIDIEEVELRELLRELLSGILTKIGCKLIFLSFETNSKKQQDLLKIIEEIVAINSNISKIGIAHDQSIILEQEKEIFDLEVLFIKNDDSLKNLLKNCRLLIDLGIQKDNLLQITAVSCGVPQIVFEESYYARHRKNAWKIDDISEVKAGIEHYLGTMFFWNQAQIFCREIIQKDIMHEKYTILKKEIEAFWDEKN